MFCPYVHIFKHNILYLYNWEFTSKRSACLLGSDIDWFSVGSLAAIRLFKLLFLVLLLFNFDCCFAYVTLCGVYISGQRSFLTICYFLSSACVHLKRYQKADICEQFFNFKTFKSCFSSPLGYFFLVQFSFLFTFNTYRHEFQIKLVRLIISKTQMMKVVCKSKDFIKAFPKVNGKYFVILTTA